MELDDPPSDLDPLLYEAISWIVRAHSGEATRADLDELQQWREMSAEHEEAFGEASRLWRACREAARQLAEEAATECTPRKIRLLRPRDAIRSRIICRQVVTRREIHYFRQRTADGPWRQGQSGGRSHRRR